MCRKKRVAWRILSVETDFVFLLVVDMLSSWVLLSKWVFLKPEIANLLTAGVCCGLSLSFLNTFASIFQEKEDYLKFSFINLSYTFLILFCILILKYFNSVLNLNKVLVVYLVITAITGAGCIGLLILHSGPLRFVKVEAVKTIFSLVKWLS